MLARSARLIAPAASSASAGAAAAAAVAGRGRAVALAVRGLSVGGHDDFARKVKKQVPEGMDEVLKLIEGQVKGNDVMLYMKGTPSAPQCGFSSQAVRILNAVGVDFGSVNVLEYASIRDGIKVYSDWPTLPQLYVKGEFVGGCDIMTSMFTSGDLEKLMRDKKLISE